MASSTSDFDPDLYARRRPALLARNRARRAIIGYFDAQDFQEVETPILQVSPGLEPHLQAFSTELTGPDGAQRCLYLHTSPEFAMKKLLAAGETRCFQFARTFRNGERGSLHHPEFTMLEWYRTGQSYLTLIDDCQALLAAAAKATGCTSLDFGGKSCDPTRPFERLSVADAFLRYCGINLDPLPDQPSFAQAASAIGVRISGDDSWDDIFFKIFLERIEPHLGVGRGTILIDYPIHMAALSRPKPGAPHLAERFELYLCGLELANAFGELTDASEQARRFAADMDLKQALYGVRYPVDPTFLAAVERLPESAGIALGFDRLVMLLTGAKRIDDVLWLPVALPEGDSQ